MRDRSLRSGERQVRATVETMEKWQRWRYTEALKYIKVGDLVLDLGCGCGSGSKILKQKAFYVFGVDDSKEALTWAKQHFNERNIAFYCSDALQLKITGKIDWVVAFEIIEHIQDTDAIFQKISELGDRVILSVPHISVALNKFHHRHFRQKDIIRYLRDYGFVVEHISQPRFGKGLAVFCVARKKYI